MGYKITVTIGTTRELGSTVKENYARARVFVQKALERIGRDHLAGQTMTIRIVPTNEVELDYDGAR